MAVLLALSLALTTALDLTPEAQIPPPYAPPADEMPAAEAPVFEADEPEEEAQPVLPAPRAYLYRSYPAQAPVLDCIINRESTWNAYARSGPYVGLAQFDGSTWMETPQGKRGLSRTDPYASIDALAWGVVHLGYGRWPNTSRRCREDTLLQSSLEEGTT
jgi:hypothetical protein